MIHTLKTTPKYFTDATNKEKTFEVRKNDRDFRVCDYIALNEWRDGTVDNFPQGYTGRSALFRISYILDNPDYCKEGYVILGIKPCFVSNIQSGELPIIYGQARGGGGND